MNVCILMVQFHQPPSPDYFPLFVKNLSFLSLEVWKRGNKAKISCIKCLLLTRQHQWRIQMKFGHSGFRKTGGYLEGRGCCEPPVCLGQRTGGVPGSSEVFLIQNDSFILNLIISMMLLHHSIYTMKLSESKTN